MTTVSGDIGVANDTSDNSYHVVTGATGATIDGFAITGGNAKGRDLATPPVADFPPVVAGAPTFPIVLTGSQQLLCKYTTASSAIIQGKGPDVAGAQATIAFHGTRNALNNCIVDGNGGTGYCVHVTYSGTFSTSPHLITNSDIGNCGTAGITIRYADNVTISNSSIHNNQIGVSWLGPNTGGSMLTNKFKANSITDIQCSVADPGVTGSGNTALGVLYCSLCGNCPF